MEKCRRRWDLADNPELQYKYMQSFDRAMNHLDKAFGFIGAPHTCAPLLLFIWNLQCMSSKPCRLSINGVVVT